MLVYPRIVIQKDATNMEPKEILENISIRSIDDLKLCSQTKEKKSST